MSVPQNKRRGKSWTSLKKKKNSSRRDVQWRRQLKKKSKNKITHHRQRNNANTRFCIHSWEKCSSFCCRYWPSLLKSCVLYEGIWKEEFKTQIYIFFPLTIGLKVFLSFQIRFSFFFFFYTSGLILLRVVNRELKVEVGQTEGEKKNTRNKKCCRSRKNVKNSTKLFFFFLHSSWRKTKKCFSFSLSFFL